MNFPNYEQIETPNISFAFAKILLVCKMSFLYWGASRETEACASSLWAWWASSLWSTLLVVWRKTLPCKLMVYSVPQIKHLFFSFWFRLIVAGWMDVVGLYYLQIYTWNYHIWYGSVQTYSSPDVLMWLRSVGEDTIQYHQGLANHLSNCGEVCLQLSEKKVGLGISLGRCKAPRTATCRNRSSISWLLLYR